MRKHEEVSIKVHCIVSCLCEVIRLHSSIDYRPFYIGLWDAPFDVTEQGCITYYQHDLNHTAMYAGFELLFGAPVIEWYEKTRPAKDNLAALLELVETCPPNRHIMVQIDLSLLPERDNKFHQKPFPHFLMVERTGSEEEWYVRDPDFRWEGTVAKDSIVEAFLGNPFGGGFYVDAERLKEPTPAAIDRFFRDVYTPVNELTLAAEQQIGMMCREGNGKALRELEGAVKQLPVLAIRKYSYEHALMYFIDESNAHAADFDHYCELVEQIVKGFNNVHYQSVKMAMTGSTALLSSVMARLDEINRTESMVKHELLRLYRIWRLQCIESLAEEAVR
jgi:petrobactin synthase